MKKKIFSMVILAAVLLCALASCGKSDEAYQIKESYDEASSENYSYSLGMKSDSDGLLSEKSEGTPAENAGDINNAQTPAVSDNRKIIETVDMTVETENIDRLMKDLEKEITALGGYIESSSYYGRSGKRDRYSATLTVRIPAASSGKFTSYVSDNGTVTAKSTSTEDVTLTYVDMESRVSALEAEKAALEEILKKARSVEDIISVRSSLTDVIYEIESYKSQLRTYDNLTSYSTVNITVDEVKEVAVVEEQSMWEEIGTNIRHNTESIRDGAEDLFVGVAGALPYIILMLVFVLVVIVVAAILKKRAKRKKSSKKIDENS